MMVPATLPLILLYRTTARNDVRPAQSQIGMMGLLAGYLAVWAAAGVPVYAYSRLGPRSGRVTNRKVAKAIGRVPWLSGSARTRYPSCPSDRIRTTLLQVCGEVAWCGENGSRRS